MSDSVKSEVDALSAEEAAKTAPTSLHVQVWPNGALAAHEGPVRGGVVYVRDDIVNALLDRWAPNVPWRPSAATKGVGYDKAREVALSTDARLVAIETENAALRAVAEAACNALEEARDLFDDAWTGGTEET